MSVHGNTSLQTTAYDVNEESVKPRRRQGPRLTDTFFYCDQMNKNMGHVARVELFATILECK